MHVLAGLASAAAAIVAVSGLVSIIISSSEISVACFSLVGCVG